MILYTPGRLRYRVSVRAPSIVRLPLKERFRMFSGPWRYIEAMADLALEGSVDRKNLNVMKGER